MQAKDCAQHDFLARILNCHSPPNYLTKAENFSIPRRPLIELESPSRRVVQLSIARTIPRCVLRQMRNHADAAHPGDKGIGFLDLAGGRADAPVSM